MSQLYYRKRCSFISSPANKGAEEVFQNIVKPNLEAIGYQVSKAEHVGYSHANYKDVVQMLLDDDLVIFDISDTDPNVCFEAGIRYMNARPVIFMAAERKVNGKRYLPPDLAHLDPIFYVSAESDMSNEGNLHTELYVSKPKITPGAEVGIKATIETVKEFMQRLNEIDKDSAMCRPILKVVNCGKICIGNVEITQEKLREIEHYYRYTNKKPSSSKINSNDATEEIPNKDFVASFASKRR